jgi:hypothetical protein
MTDILVSTIQPFFTIQADEGGSAKTRQVWIQLEGVGSWSDGFDEHDLATWPSWNAMDGLLGLTSQHELTRHKCDVGMKYITLFSCVFEIPCGYAIL